MAKVMYGCDMSHHQSEAVFQAALKDPNIDFIILKATEGKTYVDPTFQNRMRAVIASGKHVGAYHYCRPENKNTVETEVENFMNTVMAAITASSDFLSKIWLFLDAEGEAIRYAGWVESFLATVSVRYRHPIGLYSSVSHLNNQFKTIASSGRWPIWVAHYNHKDDTPESGCVHFNGESIFQRTSTPYDLDTCLVEWRGEKPRTDQTMEAKINAVLEGIRPVLEKYME